MRPCDEVGSAKQMYEKVAGYAAAVGLPLTPLKKVFAVKGYLGRSTQKAWPITCLGRGIQRHGVVPRPDRRIAVPARGHHIQLANRARSKQLLCLGIDHRA